MVLYRIVSYITQTNQHQFIAIYLISAMPHVHHIAVDFMPQQNSTYVLSHPMSDAYLIQILNLSLFHAYALA